MIIVSHESIFSPDGGIAVFSVNRKVLERACIPAQQIEINVPYKFLNPLQTVFYLYFDGGNAICSAPTSSGKTGLIYIFFSKFRGQKIYTAPTKSLCEEKYVEFKKVFPSVGIRTGDRFDFLPPQEEVVVTTYETLLSSARARSSWFENAECIVVDEIHFLFFGEHRGIFLEELLTYCYNKRVLGLSATLPRETILEISDWLNFQPFLCDWRPVPLIRRGPKRIEDIEREIFGETNKRKKLPERIADIILKLPEGEKVIVFVHKKSLGWEILRVFDNLGYYVKNETVPFEKETIFGDPVVAFHNAEIPLEEKQEIEEDFRNGKLKYLVSTQTMAYGVNLPADEAIIFVRSWAGKVMPDISTILQMEGRVGRFGITERGISNIIILSGEERVKRELQDFFIKPDTRTSLEKFLGEEVEDILSLVVLGMLSRKSDGFLGSETEVKFYISSQLKRMKTKPKYDIDKIFDILYRSGCIEKKSDGFYITVIGKSLSYSFITPVAFMKFRVRLGKIDVEKMTSKELAYLISPLLVFRKFSKSFADLLSDDLKRELQMELQMLDKDEESERVLEMWLSGLIWFYFKNPPSQFYLRSEAVSLTRFFTSLKKIGAIKISDYKIMDIALSLIHGVELGFSRFTSIKDIGFSRGNVIGWTAKKLNLTPREFFDRIKKKDPKIKSTMEKIYLERGEKIIKEMRSESVRYDRQKRAEILRRVSIEIEHIINSISSYEKFDEIFPEDIARLILSFRLDRQKVVKMTKEEMVQFLDVNF